jgi:hypothetical protein
MDQRGMPGILEHNPALLTFCLHGISIAEDVSQL